jgi:AcrR family transcriptional regulator
VSKGTIYLYFSNKEELFRQTVRDALTPIAATSRPPAAGSASRQLRDTINEQWEFLTCEPVLTATRLVIAEQSQYPDLAELYGTEVVTRFADSIARILEAGLRAGEFRELDPPVAARMLTALEVQWSSWRASGGGPMPARSSEQVLSELTEFYFQAIAPLDSAFPQADGA